MTASDASHVAGALSGAVAPRGGCADAWSQRCVELGRRTGSVMTEEEVAAMLGRQAPSRPARMEVTHAGVTVSVSCPRGRAAEWEGWLLAVCRQNRWPEEVARR